MKRFICLLIVLLFVPVLSFSEGAVYLTDHYSLFLDAHYYNELSSKGYIYDFDSLSIDLYFSSDEKSVLISKVKCFDGLLTSSGFIRLSFAASDGVLYFSYDNGEYITGRFDKASDDLWLDLAEGTFRLHPVARFDMETDQEF